MKKAWIILLALGLVLASCKGGAKDAAAADSATPGATPSSKTDVSYAFGLAFGKSLSPLGVDVDLGALNSGIKDAMAKAKVRFDDAQVQSIIQKAISDARTKLADTNKAKGGEFLAANGKKDGIKTTPSGLQYQVLTEGSGPKPKATDTVKVNYVGTLLDGTKFDSSIDRGQPATFQVNQVIPGWAEAVQLMSVGSKYRVWIPGELAYGADGAGGQLPPNSTLVFDIDLLSIEPSATK